MSMTIKPRWGDDLKSDELKKKYEDGKKIRGKLSLTKTELYCAVNFGFYQGRCLTTS